MQNDATESPKFTKSGPSSPGSEINLPSKYLNIQDHGSSTPQSALQVTLDSQESAMQLFDNDEMEGQANSNAFAGVYNSDLRSRVRPADGNRIEVVNSTFSQETQQPPLPLQGSSQDSNQSCPQNLEVILSKKAVEILNEPEGLLGDYYCNERLAFIMSDTPDQSGLSSAEQTPPLVEQAKRKFAIEKPAKGKDKFFPVSILKPPTAVNTSPYKVHFVEDLETRNKCQSHPSSEGEPMPEIKSGPYQLEMGQDHPQQIQFSKDINIIGCEYGLNTSETDLEQSKGDLRVFFVQQEKQGSSNDAQILLGGVDSSTSSATQHEMDLPNKTSTVGDEVGPLGLTEKLDSDAKIESLQTITSMGFVSIDMADENAHVQPVKKDDRPKKSIAKDCLNPCNAEISTPVKKQVPNTLDDLDINNSPLRSTPRKMSPQYMQDLADKLDHEYRMFLAEKEMRQQERFLKASQFMKQDVPKEELIELLPTLTDISRRDSSLPPDSSRSSHREQASGHNLLKSGSKGSIQVYQPHDIVNCKEPIQANDEFAIVPQRVKSHNEDLDSSAIARARHHMSLKDLRQGVRTPGVKEGGNSTVEQNSSHNLRSFSGSVIEKQAKDILLNKSKNTDMTDYLNGILNVRGQDRSEPKTLFSNQADDTVMRPCRVRIPLQMQSKSLCDYYNIGISTTTNPSELLFSPGNKKGGLDTMANDSSYSQKSRQSSMIEFLPAKSMTSYQRSFAETPIVAPTAEHRKLSVDKPNQNQTLNGVLPIKPQQKMAFQNSQTQNSQVTLLSQHSPLQSPGAKPWKGQTSHTKVISRKSQDKNKTEGRTIDLLRDGQDTGRKLQMLERIQEKYDKIKEIQQRKKLDDKLKETASLYQKHLNNYLYSPLDQVSMLQAGSTSISKSSQPTQKSCSSQLSKKELRDMKASTPSLQLKKSHQESSQQSKKKTSLVTSQTNSPKLNKRPSTSVLFMTLNGKGSKEQSKGNPQNPTLNSTRSKESNRSGPQCAMEKKQTQGVKHSKMKSIMTTSKQNPEPAQPPSRKKLYSQASSPREGPSHRKCM